MDASCSSKYWDCVGGELQAEEDLNLRELSQQTYYGSAPEHLWTELREPEDDPIGRRKEKSGNEDQTFGKAVRRIPSIDPSQLEIVESIAEGGQAHVFLAKYTRRPGGMKQDVVVKRYKGLAGVGVVQQLRRRMETVSLKAFQVCKPFGLSKDNITGEVSVVMEAYGGDLRNLIDKRMDYLKSRMPSELKDDDAAQMTMEMPFPYRDTLKMILEIAKGMEYLHSLGFIHRDLKASNIFVSPYDKDMDSFTIHNSRKVEFRGDLGYAGFLVVVGDYERSDAVMGTGLWRAPEVLKALKENMRPTITAAVDMYGFGMVCYELLTGHIPFQCEDIRATDYDVVLSGRTPKLPAYLSPTMNTLLHACWIQNPCKRPGWDTIKDYITGDLSKRYV
ncbi:unnamed protein product [Sphagnum troendelagicum]|uniref:Protein kinase domain-containing protein n=1 Tax=Sphagnum troendelagicum TaxID=128251 RepID=A0ABP0TC51_9BRYO